MDIPTLTHFGARRFGTDNMRVVKKPKCDCTTLCRDELAAIPTNDIVHDRRKRTSPQPLNSERVTKDACPTLTIPATSAWSMFQFESRVMAWTRVDRHQLTGRAGSVCQPSLNHRYHVLPDGGVRALSQKISGCGKGLASAISLPAPDLPLECIKAGVG